MICRLTLSLRVFDFVFNNFFNKHTSHSYKNVGNKHLIIYFFKLICTVCRSIFLILGSMQSKTSNWPHENDESLISFLEFIFNKGKINDNLSVCLRAQDT